MTPSLTRRHRAEPAPSTEPKEQNTMNNDTDAAHLRELAVAMIPPVDRHDEAERAADCFERAEALRETIPDVEAAQTELAAIEAEAARVVNAARAKLRDVQAVADSVEKAAAAVEDTGRSYQAAANLAQQAVETWRGAEELAAERQERLTDAEALTVRLGDLDGLQRAAQADLEAARASTDAEAAGEARTRLVGLQEVTPVLVAQRDTATARARAIGTEDSGGEFAQALTRVTGLMRQREQALDNAEPARVEARRAANPLGALLEDIGNLPTAARDQILESWSAMWQQQAGQPQTTVQGSGNGARTAVVRRNA